MSGGAKRSISISSENSDYDVSDLLSIVAKECCFSQKQCSNDGDAKQEIAESRSTSGAIDQQTQISLRERRRNRVQGIPSTICGQLNVSRVDANGNSVLPSTQTTAASARKSAVWKRAFTKAIASGDPWSNEGFDALPVEIATRYRFDTRQRKWVVDQVNVKMQDKPFGRGAMRECYRLKKKSNFATKSQDFTTASNCVAKRYLDPSVTRQTYFDDVYLQMDAKHWAERFNQNEPDPPKKIDLIQVAILEFINRPGSPLYHLEHFIEGEYTKYNSNSGFIDSHARMTPQAFSHFTFEKSAHQSIVVDVQGVGDLYTDPQIHTAYTSDMYGADEAPPYGDGNLGVRGMALFCYTHRCNQICALLGLSPFAHSANELGGAVQRWRSLSISGAGQQGSSVSSLGGAESPLGATIVRQRSRTRSGGSFSSDDAFGDCLTPPVSSLTGINVLPGIFPIREDVSEVTTKRQACESDAEPSPKPSASDEGIDKSPPTSHDGDGESDNDSTKPEEPTRHTRKRIESQMLPDDADVILAGIVDPMDYDAERHPKRFSADQILALVHLDFARCYDSGRFAAVDQLMLAAVGATPVDSVLLRTSDSQQDYAARNAGLKNADAPPGVGIGLGVGAVHLSRDECESALFHLDEAAKLGSRDALRLLARVYLNLERDLLNCLQNAPFAQDVFNAELGLSYMRKVAEFDADAALFLAELHELGHSTKCPLPNCVVEKDARLSIGYYEKAVGMMDEGSDQQGQPIYEVQAKLASLFASDSIRDYAQAYDYYSAAAESATAAMKGKLASRYYELAEEVSGMIED